jgi:hypothetical protein
MWVNNKLNVIYPRVAERVEVRKLAAEFAYHANPFRRLLQSIYVRYGTSQGTEALLSDSVLIIDPWIDQLDNWCIIPGNHSIRIVDLSANICHVLLKKGFSAKFLESELMVREKFPYLPIPELLDADAEAGWFREKQVSGLPLNRLADTVHRNEALNIAQEVLVRLYEETTQTANSGIWAEKIHAACLQEAGCLPGVYLAAEVDRIKNCARRLLEYIVTEAEEVITTVQSHGDLQPANILVNVAGTNVHRMYLIDWEYSARRSVYYDALVFTTRSRFPHGLAERVERLFIENNESDWNWCSPHETLPKMPPWVVAIFLLEDLLVRLQEQQIPGLKKKSDGLMQFLVEVEEVAWLQS